MKHIVLFFLLVMSFSANAAMKIVASYPPVQSLVWSISQDVHPVSVLINNNKQGHHDITLKPTQVKTLREADIVFWIGEDLENFMPQALKTNAPEAFSVPLMQETADLTLLKNNVNNEKFDVHFWLNPNNAKKMLETIAMVLSQKDPTNADKYQKNKEKAISYFDQLKDIQKPDKNKKIIAFHDGFSYMNDYFGLNIQTVPFDIKKTPTPQDLKKLQDYLKTQNPDCIIIEPQMSRRQEKNFGLKKLPSVKMDGFGWNIKNGPGQYYRMMNWNMKALRQCTN